MSNKRRLKKNPLEDMAILTRLARKASREAVKEAFKSGIAIHYISYGKLIREYPDGKKEYIKDLKII